MDLRSKTRTTRAGTIEVAGALALAVAVAVTGCSAGTDTVESGRAATSASAPPVALAGNVSDHGTTDISASGAAESVDMELDDSYFGPTYVKAAPGAVVAVELKNEGSKTHTFTLDDRAIDVSLEPGRSSKVDVTIPPAGNLHFFCRIHSGAGMQGTFFTTAGTSAPAPGADPTTTATTDPYRPGY